MPRAAKRDLPLTQRLLEAGFFTNTDSFVGQDGHLYLKGVDKSRMRLQVFRKAKGLCEVCGHSLYFSADKFTTFAAAWHHKAKCDCVGCSELRCDETTGRPCHAHRRPGFDRDAEKMKAKAQAVKDFEKVYPKEGQ